MPTAVQSMGVPHLAPGVDTAREAQNVGKVASNEATTAASEGIIKRDSHKVGGDPAQSVDKANSGADAARLNSAWKSRRRCSSAFRCSKAWLRCRRR
jgi:hypothetical protein